jgi:hypothetical protein
MEALTLQSRLVESIAQARRYGDTDNRRAERAQILDILNQLTADVTGAGFNELCEWTQLRTAANAPDEKAPGDLMSADQFTRRVTSLDIRLEEGVIRVALVFESGKCVSGLMHYDAGEFEEVTRAFRDLQRWTYRYSKRTLLGHLKGMGNRIYEWGLPPKVKEALRDFQAPQSLLLSTDAAMANVPWELNHDGTDFLCLQHAVGRQMPSTRLRTTVRRDRVGLRILVLGPSPMGISQNGVLPDPEVASIQRLCKEHQIACQTLEGDDITASRVVQHLFSGYDIMHIIGHQARDGLLLADGSILNRKVLLDAVSDTPPDLAVLSACETGLTEVRMTRGLVESGAIVIGSYGWISSECSTAIMTSLYTGLFQGQPIGEALRKARLGTKEACPEWWGFVLYGDPSLSLWKK